jgi:hypothetical protein
LSDGRGAANPQLGGPTGRGAVERPDRLETGARYAQRMFRMAVGHSDDIDLDAALAAVFASCDAALDGATPTAGLLLATWDADHQLVLDAIHRRYPQIALAGASTSGEMSSVMGYQQDSIALALFATDGVEITVGLGRAIGADPHGAAREAVVAARGAASLPSRLCIALPSIGVVDTAVLLTALRSELGPDVPILGGGASPLNPVADPAATSGLQFAGTEVTAGGIAILLFSGPLDYSFGVETGWRAVGPRALVTKVEDGRVVEIDGQAAVGFFDRHLGASAGKPPPVANPLAVFDPVDSARFYLRTATNLDQASGSVAFFGSVPEGATVQLTVAAADEIVDGARASVADALSRFPGGRTPDAVLLLSCATRRFLLGSRTGREVDIARTVVGAATPVAGFYCLGEIAPIVDGDLSRFHNATMVSVLLGAS